MKRRSFMASILAAGFAPAAVGSGILMPVRKIVAPPDVIGLPDGRILIGGGGGHGDHYGMEYSLDGKHWISADAQPGSDRYSVVVPALPVGFNTIHVRRAWTA